MYCKYDFLYSCTQKNIIGRKTYSQIYPYPQPVQFTSHIHIPFSVKTHFNITLRSIHIPSPNWFTDQTFQTKFYTRIFLSQMHLTRDSHHPVHNMWWVHITNILTKLKQISSKSRKDTKTHFVSIGAPVVLWYRTGIGTPHTLWRDIHQYGRRSSCAINPPPLLVLPP